MPEGARTEDPRVAASMLDPANRRAIVGDHRREARASSARKRRKALTKRAPESTSSISIEFCGVAPLPSLLAPGIVPVPAASVPGSTPARLPPSHGSPDHSCNTVRAWVNATTASRNTATAEPRPGAANRLCSPGEGEDVGPFAPRVRSPRLTATPSTRSIASAAASRASTTCDGNVLVRRERLAPVCLVPTGATGLCGVSGADGPPRPAQAL